MRRSVVGLLVEAEWEAEAEEAEGQAALKHPRRLKRKRALADSTLPRLLDAVETRLSPPPHSLKHNSRAV